MADITPALRQHWDARAAAHPKDDLAAVDMTVHSQRKRFAAGPQWPRNGTLEVLDVGCGTGAYWEHLQELMRTTHPGYVMYTGIDVSAAMVARAREAHPLREIRVASLPEWETDRQWDYVTAFAVFNVKMPGQDEGKAFSHLLTCLKWMFDHCKRAVHVSLLDRRHKEFGPDALTWDPLQVMLAAQAISPWTVLSQAYLPHDFALTIYREQQ